MSLFLLGETGNVFLLLATGGKGSHTEARIREFGTSLAKVYQPSEDNQIFDFYLKCTVGRGGMIGRCWGQPHVNPDKGIWQSILCSKKPFLSLVKFDLF